MPGGVVLRSGQFTLLEKEVTVAVTRPLTPKTT